MSPHDVLASFIDLAPEEDDFLTEVRRGLSQPRKTLPCKFFYDARGSELFERSEEHTSELQSLMRISYAVFCLKKKKKKQIHSITHLTLIHKRTRSNNP